MFSLSETKAARRRPCNNSSDVDAALSLLGYGRLLVHVDARESDGVDVPRALEGVQLVVHHPAVLEADAVLPVDGSAGAGRVEGLGRVHEGVVVVHLRLAIRLHDDGKFPVGAARKRLVGVHLRPIEVVLHGVGVAGLSQQVAVHHGLIDGVVDVGLVVRSRLGELHVGRTEDVPLAHVDGGLFVLAGFVPPPVGKGRHKP